MSCHFVNGLILYLVRFGPPSVSRFIAQDFVNGSILSILCNPIILPGRNQDYRAAAWNSREQHLARGAGNPRVSDACED